jgi:hypothetical protein
MGDRPERAGGPAEAERATSSRITEAGDDFLADRHVDLDAGEFGGAMTDADYHDRISTSTEPIT